MNTKNLKRVNELYKINPEVEEAVNLIYDDVDFRLQQAMRAHSEAALHTDSKQFLQGKRDAYWNIQDMLAKLKKI